MFLLQQLFVVAFVSAAFDGLVPKGTCWIASPGQTPLPQRSHRRLSGDDGTAKNGDDKSDKSSDQNDDKEISIKDDSTAQNKDDAARTSSGEPIEIIKPGENYLDMLDAFIKPMMENIPKEFRTVKQRANHYKRNKELMEKVKVTYVDDFVNPTSNGDEVREANELGIWSVKFGQFVFEFGDGKDPPIVFNGLLPAIGIPNIEELKDLPATWGVVVNGDDEREKSMSSRFSVWVVHQDPDDTSAYFVSLSDSEKREVSSIWKDKRDFCGSKNSEEWTHSVRTYGNCDKVPGNIEQSIKKHFKDYKFNDRCAKIVLCSGGAFKFTFQTKLKLWSTFGKKQLHLFAAKVSAECGQMCGPRHIANVQVHHDGKERCPKLSTAMDFQCRSRISIRNDKQDSFGDWKDSHVFGSRYDWTYRVLPPQTSTSGKEEPDDYKCEEKMFKKNKCAKCARPRFQFKTKHDTVKTCCIKRISRPGPESLPVAEYDPTAWGIKNNDEDEYDDDDDDDGSENDDFSVASYRHDRTMNMPSQIQRRVSRSTASRPFHIDSMNSSVATTESRDTASTMRHDRQWRPQ
mmetsp:Transcript_35573/g.58292  ORF Transcript_35573/g.58292 Transcript_35573/m.58292 type:complete len:572 (+) Transcript_35573:192-1907(+)